MSDSSSASAPAVSSVLQFLVAGGEDLDSSQLRDDLMTLLIAGHETTAAALSWALLLLARNPRVLAEMRKEVRRARGCGEKAGKAIARVWGPMVLVRACGAHVVRRARACRAGVRTMRAKTGQLTMAL